MEMQISEARPSSLTTIEASTSQTPFSNALSEKDRTFLDRLVTAVYLAGAAGTLFTNPIPFVAGFPIGFVVKMLKTEPNSSDMQTHGYTSLKETLVEALCDKPFRIFGIIGGFTAGMWAYKKFIAYHFSKKQAKENKIDSK